MANLIAVPITSFIIMPALIAGFILYPFGALKYALIPMEQGIEIIVKISHYIASMPGAIQILPSMPEVSLLLITLGGLILCLFSGAIRKSGVIAIIIGFIIMMRDAKPDLFIDGRSRNFAILNDANNLVFSSRKFSNFTKESWLHFIGKTTAANQKITLKDNVLHHNKNGYDLNFVCEQKKYLQISGDIKINDKVILPFNQIKANGGTLIYLNKEKIKITQQNNYNRPWQQD
jgi:competence protein ComEC